MHKNDAVDARKKRGQSESIAELLQQLPQGTHVTAPQVFELAQKAGIQISLSSVYRTLNLLKNAGQVGALSGEHGVRYEARHTDHDHDHLICMVCGFTVEFEDDLIKGFGQDLARRKGYDYKRSRFDIYGLCLECQSKSDEHKVRQSITVLGDVGGKMQSIMNLLDSALNNLDARKVERSCEAIEEALQLLEGAPAQLETVLSRLKSMRGDEHLSIKRSQQ